MRYRRLGIRYAMVLHSVHTRSLDDWPTDRLRLLVQGSWRPDADAYETVSTIEIVVDLAGVQEDDVEVQIFDDAVVVEGVRPIPPSMEETFYLVAGIRRGPFRLELPLPAAADSEHVEARFDRGLLRVSLGKRAGGV